MTAPALSTNSPPVAAHSQRKANLPIENRAWAIMASAPPSLLRLAFNDAQVREYLRGRLFHRQQVVARAAVLRHLLPIGAGMAVVVTSEASGRVCMPDVIRICAPGDLHRRKYIPVIDSEQVSRGRRHFRLAFFINGRISLPIESLQCLRYPGGRRFPAGVILLQDLHTLLPDERQSRGKVSCKHSFVHSPFRQLITVGWAIVAVDAIHFPYG